MTRELELRLGKPRLSLHLEASTVVLCDNQEHAARMARAFADVGGTVIDGVDAARGTVSSQFGRKIDADRVAALVTALHLPDDIGDWRPRDLSLLQRVLAASLVAAVTAADLIVFDVTHIAASPFDVAHVFAHAARLRAAVNADVVMLIADPAFISSAGQHLIALNGDEIVETGTVASMLSDPASDALRVRLESTPIPSPLAMQMRRVQRASTVRVDYSHTQIIALPTQDSIALAGGDE